MSRRDVLRQFTKAVNDKSRDTVGSAVNLRRLSIPRLSTGSLVFDYAMGGGIPVGHMVIFRGSSSSGKTTAAIRTAGLAQNLCANCLRPVADFEVVESEPDPDTGEVYYDAKGTCDCYRVGLFKPRQHVEEKNLEYRARLKEYEENSFEEFKIAFFDIENTLDLDWCKRVGLDTRRLYLAQPSTAEETIDLYDELMRTGAIDMFVLDSLAAMTPAIEVEASTLDEQMGAQAKLLNKFIRKMNAARVDCQRDFGFIPTQIWINQERITMGGGWGDNTVMPGGEGQKFGSSAIIKMWASKIEKEKVDTDLKKEFQMELGTKVRMNFKLMKNKVSASYSSGGYVIKVSGADRGKVDDFKYVVEQAIKYGLFRENEDGKKKTWFVGDEEFEIKKDAMARMQKPSVFEHLKKSVLRMMLEGIGNTTYK